MKKAEEILMVNEVEHWDWMRCKGTTPDVYAAILDAMKQYAEQAIREATEKAKVYYGSDERGHRIAIVDKQSILSLINEL